MRSARRAFVILAVMAAAVPIARAGGHGDRIDVSKVKSDLVVLHDGHGHYLVVRPYKLGPYFFYGNGKVFYAQRLIGGSYDKSDRSFSRIFWAPRTPHSTAALYSYGGHWHVECGERKTPLVVEPAARARKILDHAVFKKPLWKRRAHFLARNDRGVYFYVDQFRKTYGGKGYRLFVGFKGKLRRTHMVDVVSDSVGEIFATKSGDLRLVHNKNTAVWVHRHHHSKLTIVPVYANQALIYRDLGVYPGRLGVPCDDM